MLTLIILSSSKTGFKHINWLLFDNAFFDVSASYSSLNEFCCVDLMICISTSWSSSGVNLTWHLYTCGSTELVCVLGVSAVFGPNCKRKISNIHKDFEPYKVFIYNFRCQTVLKFPCYKPQGWPKKRTHSDFIS